jgi:helix-turn-helix protein
MPQNALVPRQAIASGIPGRSSGFDRPVRHLNQVDLARRWNLSPRTLERWRWLKQGPGYLKIGGRVVYRLEDIEAFEAEQVRTASASTNVGGAR